jgi:hypothetical protein
MMTRVVATRLDNPPLDRTAGTWASAWSEAPRCARGRSAASRSANDMTRNRWFLAAVLTVAFSGTASPALAETSAAPGAAGAGLWVAIGIAYLTRRRAVGGWALSSPLCWRSPPLRT